MAAISDRRACCRRRGRTFSTASTPNCASTSRRARDIFEITRFCLDRALCAQERRAVRDTLVTALAEHAVANGISAYTAIADMGWLQQILAFGWRCRPLGLPLTIAGKLLGALSIEIDAGTPRLLAEAGIVALRDPATSAAA